MDEGKQRERQDFYTHTQEMVLREKTGSSKYSTTTARRLVKTGKSPVIQSDRVQQMDCSTSTGESPRRHLVARQHRLRFSIRSGTGGASRDGGGAEATGTSATGA